MDKNLASKSYYLVYLLALSMISFAGNSIICRLALKETQIDAASFTSIRILSAAIMLWLIICWQNRSKQKQNQGLDGLKIDNKDYLTKGGWLNKYAPPAYLFIYAACFSLAYRHIDTGVGALILFASVQLSMIGYGLFRGERLNGKAIAGLALSFSGLIYMLLPGASTPSFSSAFTMILSGIAWGAYSLSGKNAKNSTAASAYNFIYALPLAILLSLLLIDQLSLDSKGVIYAIMSGALFSSYGYMMWYKVLPLISSILASALQLSVPIIAAIGGIVFLGEQITLTLFFVSVVTLSGIALVIFNK